MPLEAVPDHEEDRSTPRTAAEALDILQRALRAELPDDTEYRRIPTRSSRGFVETLVVVWANGQTFFYDAEAEHR